MWMRGNKTGTLTFTADLNAVVTSCPIAIQAIALLQKTLGKIDFPFSFSLKTVAW